MKDLNKWFFAFFVTNYRVSFLFIFLIVVAWLISLFTIPKESSPDIKIWIISISTAYPWVSPDDIDNLITEKLETEIKDIDWIKKITSSSMVWLSSINVELENWINTRDVLTDIKDEVDTVSLPEDAEDPFVLEISTKNELLFDVLLYWDSTKYDNFRLNILAKKLKDNLEWKAGISSINIGWTDVNRIGWWEATEYDYDIKVLVSKEKLELLWLNMAQISNKIRSENRNTPIWNYKIWDLRYDFRFDWEFSNIEELKNLVVSWEWVSQVRLKDIADFKKEYPESSIQSLWFYDNTWNNYIALSINKNPWDNVFAVAKTAKKEIENFISNNSEFDWLWIKYTNDMADLIVKDYKNLWNTALQTLFFVFIVILFFVWIRESIIASFLLPLAFLITFIVLEALGFSLNFLTNFSLVLTLWIAIDTIIVIVEWAAERQSLGYSRKYAILLALKELKAPLISGTMTTLVAFAPMIFLPGIMWKFLAYIPITVFTTLVAALFLSLTISSALFFKLSKKKNYYHEDLWYESRLSSDEKDFLVSQRKWKKKRIEHESKRSIFLEKLWNFYLKALDLYLHKKHLRRLSIFVPVVLLFISFFALSPRIGFTLFPSTDEWVITIAIESKTWTDKDSLEKYLSDVDYAVSKYPEISVYNSTISWNTISTSITLIDKFFRQDNWMKNVFEIEELILKDLEKLESNWLKVSVKSLEWWPPAWKPVWIKLIASDNKKLIELKKVAEEFETYLKTISWTRNVSISSSDNPWQFVFVVDRQKLDYIWLSSQDILSELYYYTSWIKSGSIKSNLEDNDIILKISDFDKSFTPEDINNLIINTKVWKIRVGDYVSYSFDKSLSSINREDNKISISVESDLAKWITPDKVQPKLISFAETYNYPTWISYISGWENSENSELIISTFKSLFIALFLIFSILVFQFNSFSQPLIILYSVILALLWVNIWLFVTWNPYSMPFAIWFIALTWVVVNDAIILVDRINKNIARLHEHIWKHKLKLEDYVKAIVEWGKSRLQPIIVTTLTTMFWVLPLALQDEFWAWLWFTVIFWLFAGSSMTLFIIPALYYSVYLRKKMN